MWKANKFISLLLLVLALISVFLCVHVFYTASQLILPADNDKMIEAIGPVFAWVGFLIALTVVLTVFLPIPALIQHPKSAMGIGVGILALGVVILVAKGMASTDALPFSPGHDPVSNETLIFADINMISTYIVLGGTIAALVITGVIDMIKMR